MKNIRNWMSNNIEAVLIAAACVLAIALTVTIILLCTNSNSKETFDVVNWTINPANPASPLHIGH